MNGFRIYQLEGTAGQVPTYSRRDFYTVCLLTGPRQLQRADQQAELHGTCLLIGNPAGANFSTGAAARHSGYACRFTEAFFKAHTSVSNPAQWALLNSPVPRVFELGSEQAVYLNGLFEKMLAEQQTAYVFKKELLGSYLNLVLHEALRLRAPAPVKGFRYYFRPPGPAGELGGAWGSRRGRPL